MPIAPGPDGPIHFIEAGKGEGDPVVLLHGLGGDVEFWEADTALLAEDRRVIAVDLRGSGGTPASEGGHTMAQLADDVSAVLDYLTVPRADVVGFSMGGCVAQEYALAYPDRVGRLILASTYARMSTQARMFLDAVHATYQRTRSAKEMFDLICPWLFSEAFLADPTHADWLVYEDESLNEAEMIAWSRAYLAQRAFNVTSRLREITAPTLVLHGEHDALVSASDADRLQSELATARLVTFPGAGHLVNVEAPARFIHTIREHLALRTVDGPTAPA